MHGFVLGFLDVSFDPEQLEYLEATYNETNIKEKTIAFDFVDYEDDKDALRGFIAYPRRPQTDDAPLPLVIVNPDWDGLDDYEIWRAKLLAQAGYVAFVADIFGTNIEQGPKLPIEDRQKLISKYFGKPMAERLAAAVEAAVDSELIEVDVTKIAMTGYCFGASGIMEMQFVELPGLRGVAPTHPGGLIPKTKPKGDCHPVSVLVLNGAEDPSNSHEDLKEFFKFSDDLGVNWEFTNYGQTRHAFTIPTNPRDGEFIAYNPFADVRSFASLLDFLDKIFAEDSLYPTCQ